MNITGYNFFFCLYKCSKALREELSYKSGISTFIRNFITVIANGAVCHPFESVRNDQLCTKERIYVQKHHGRGFSTTT